MFESATLMTEVGDLTARLGTLDASGMDAASRIDLVHALEVLKCAAEAAQAAVSADLGDDRGAAAQVALARRESPHRGRQHLSLARVLRDELPCTRAAFRAGAITEWRATVIARETACLSREDRLAVDRAIAGDPEALASYSDRVVLAELHKLAARLGSPASSPCRGRAVRHRPAGAGHDGVPHGAPSGRPGGRLLCRAVC